MNTFVIYKEKNTSETEKLEIIKSGNKKNE